MARFVIRPSNSDLLKVIESVTPEDSKARMLEYYNADPGVQFYRIEAQGNDFLLKRLRPRAGSEVRGRPVVTDVTFEDQV